MDERELAYYKSKLDALTGELINKDYAVAQLTNESRQLQSGFKLLLSIGSEFYKHPELNDLASFCCENTLRLLSLDQVILLRRTEDNYFKIFAKKGTDEDVSSDETTLSLSRLKNWFDDKDTLLINGNSKMNDAELDICEWSGFPFCVAAMINIDQGEDYMIFGGRKSERKPLRHLPLSETDVYIFQSVASLFSDLAGKLMFDKKLEEERSQNAKRLEEYNARLEIKVEERTKEITEQKNLIEEERQKSEALLLNILPSETAEELKLNGKSEPRRFEEVSVLFTDFVSFSKVSERVTADVLVNEIHHYFSAFDNIISKYNLEKIKTIGDSYMCAGGIPVSLSDHACLTVRAALEIADFVNKTRLERLKTGELSFEIRIGVHSGPVVAGIVGIRKFAYDIWGDTVNYASRMESSGQPGRVNISGITYNLIKHRFKCTYRGKIEAKGKGYLDMYFVDNEIKAGAG